MKDTHGFKLIEEGGPRELIAEKTYRMPSDQIAQNNFFERRYSISLICREDWRTNYVQLLSDKEISTQFYLRKVTRQ